MHNSISRQRFDDTAALEAAVQALIRDELQAQHDVPHALMLSGGRTPLPVYARVAEAPFKPDGFAHVLFTDDRHVPVDSPDSNFGGARGMLCALGLPEERILRIDPRLDLDACAADYDKQIGAFFATGGLIATALLGIGTDGHTCSLFTKEDILAAEGKYAIPVVRPEPPHRISVTPEVLARAERVIFLASGPDKEEIVERLITAPEHIVAGRAAAGCRHVTVWQA